MLDLRFELFGRRLSANIVLLCGVYMDESFRFGRNRAEFPSRCEQCGNQYRAGTWIAFDNWSDPVRKLCIKCADFERDNGRGNYRGESAKAPVKTEASRTDLDAVHDTRGVSSASITEQRIREIADERICELMDGIVQDLEALADYMGFELPSMKRERERLEQLTTNTRS